MKTTPTREKKAKSKKKLFWFAFCSANCGCYVVCGEVSAIDKKKSLLTPVRAFQLPCCGRERGESRSNGGKRSLL